MEEEYLTQKAQREKGKKKAFSKRRERWYI